MITPAEKKALTELLNFCFEPGEIHGRNEIETAIVMLEILLYQYRPTITVPVSECCKGKIGWIKGSLKIGYHQCCSCGKEVKGQVLDSYMTFLQTIPDQWITAQALQLAALFPEEKEIAYRISREAIKHLIRKGFDMVQNKPIELCECETPYFPTGDTGRCSKCNKPTIYK